MRQQSKKTPAASQPSSATHHPWRRWRFRVILLVLLVAGAGLCFVAVYRAPKLPAVALTGLDPPVAKQIQNAMREVQRSPRSGAAWGKLGAVLLYYEFKPEAQSAFLQAERLAPAEPRWPYLHGLMLMDGQAEAAIPWFQAAAELCHDQPDMPRLRLAQLLLERGRLDQAETNFQALLRSQATHPLALLGLARIRLAQGRLADSTNLLARCADDPHAARNAQTLLAQIYQQLGNPAAAETAARKSADLPPDRPWPDPYWGEILQERAGIQTRLDEAEALIRQGHWDEAFQVLTKVTNEYPRDAEAYYHMGWILNQRQQGVDAERLLREHLRLAPESPKGLAQMAAALLGQKRYADAIEVLQHGIRLAPSWSELHFNLGFACAHLGRDDEAIAHFRTALRLDPKYVDSYITLADLLSRRGQTDEAIQLLRQALALDPANEGAQFLLKRLGAKKNEK